jgi:hypothetical protein
MYYKDKEEFIENSFKNDKDEIIKNKTLDEKFKKAFDLKTKRKTKKTTKKNLLKKPFYKLGIYLIIVGLICLLVINLLPWIYVKYDNNIAITTDHEFFYFQNFKIETNSNDTTFSSFFQTMNSSKYLGISSTDLVTTSQIQTYILYIFILLGFIYTSIIVLTIKSNLEMNYYILIHSIFIILISILCIYFIFCSIRFIGANILVLFNNQYISPNIENLNFIIIAPFISILIISVVLKISFTLLKIDFSEFEKIINNRTQKKTISHFKPGVET